MSPGDAAIIFTPDDTHAFLASACLQAGLHVLVAKPLVRTLAQHRALIADAEAAGTMVRHDGATGCTLLVCVMVACVEHVLGALLCA
jgi:hypothetical protein